VIPGGYDIEGGIAQVVGEEPTPAFAVQVAEEYEQLLERLGDPNLRSIAQWKLEGYTNSEIATRLGCVERTVERKLDLIRKTWEKESAP
jgi:DNA-directed RNA polymerase specialized sigma24 family protein